MSLPSGTVTFIFTDIEGFTRLWEEHSEAMRLALARHDSLMRSAIEKHDGHVFKTIGDAFCAAFHTAPDALQAALSAQQALTSEAWPEGVTLKVRMALHTGAAEVRDNDYFGQPLNRVARLLAAGHGGQVLLSLPTEELARDLLPAAVGLQVLGEYRLRDLNRPETIFQLLHPDLLADFPPLKSLSGFPNNLPWQLTSFIGREKEIAEIRNLLVQARLLTLTGSGGCGKTRLSLQVAAEVLDDYPDGVFLVELAPLIDATLVPQTVASVLSLTEQTGKTFTQVLTEHLKSKHLLLLLDNCEHLLTDCATLSEILLRTCPQVRILASSREGLGIAGERTYRIPSLSLPDTKQAITRESLSQYEAVRLFIERALFHRGDFAVTDQNAPALASVCHRLDGIPLAIELAAARVRSMSVEEINARLDNRFRLLTGGSKTAMPRQQTLRALIDWSYALLNAKEKLLLIRLSVFVGGWTMEAAEQVCADDGAEGEYIEDWEILDLLSSLVDKSLIVAEERNETTRYRLLETVRQYARERLVESEASLFVREKHRNYFLALAAAARPKLEGPEQAQWLDILEEDHDNLRLALTFCLEQPEGVEEGLRLGTAMRLFWGIRGYLSEGRQHLAAVLSRPVRPEHLKARAAALNGAGNLAEMQGDYGTARALCEKSLGIRRELGDMQGITFCLSNLSNVASHQGDYTTARNLCNESLAICRKLGDTNNIAVHLGLLSNLARCQSDYATARTLCEEALRLNREINNPHSEACNLMTLGSIAADQGDCATARTLFDESLTIFQTVGDRRRTADGLNGLAVITYQQGDYAVARTLYEESLAIHRELGGKSEIAACLGNLGLITQDQGDSTSAAALYRESLAAYRELGDRHGIACLLLNLGTVTQDQRAYDGARALYDESLTLFRELGDQRGIAYSLDALASLASDEQQCLHAASLWGAATAVYEAIGSCRPAVNQLQYDHQTDHAREALGGPAFDAAFEEGRSMTLEQAVAYALEE